MIDPNDKIELSPGVVDALRHVRILLRRYVLAQSLLMAAGWVILVFWLGGLLDYFPVTLGSNETPRWLRIGLLLVMGGGCLWAVLVWGLPRWMVRIEDRSIALLIERHYPNLNNELVTAIELQQQELEEFAEISNPMAYRRMLSRVHNSLDDRIGVVSLPTLFNWQPVWGAAIGVGFGLALTAIAMVGIPEWVGLWSQRLFTLSNEPWPRKAFLRADGIQIQAPTFTGQLAAVRTTIGFEDGRVRVPSGASVLLQVSAEAGQKQVPEVCTLFYASDDGSRGRANLRRMGRASAGWQPFGLDGPPLDGIHSNLTLDVVGLDARLRDLVLETVAPAVVSRMRLRCKYPEYLLNSLERSAAETIAYRSGIKIPQGTEVSLLGETSSPLREVQYLVLRANPDASEEPSELDAGSVGPSSRIVTLPTQGNTFEIPLGTLHASQTVEVRLTDQFGLFSERVLQYTLSMQEDSIPEVSTRLAGIGNAITPVAILPVRGTVTDDNGVRLVAVDLAASDSSSAKVPIELNEEALIEHDVDLRNLAERGVFRCVPGESIGLVVTAEDFYDLSEESHQGRGQTQQLSVVTADELLVILDRKELELRQRLEVIISELEQLREVLQTLSVQDTQARHGEGTARRLTATSVLSQQTGTDDQAQRRRMHVFRAQQSVLQGDKSEQELLGVANRIDDIRMQLVNNRIDSYDRQTRLNDKVYLPLSKMLASAYPELSKRLVELQNSAMSGDSRPQARQAMIALDAVLVELLEIKLNMLDIESFNEIIELVRELLDEEERLLQQTERIRREKILQLLQ